MCAVERGGRDRRVACGVGGWPEVCPEETTDLSLAARVSSSPPTAQTCSDLLPLLRSPQILRWNRRPHHHWHWRGVLRSPPTAQISSDLLPLLRSPPMEPPSTPPLALARCAVEMMPWRLRRSRAARVVVTTAQISDPMEPPAVHRSPKHRLGRHPALRATALERRGVGSLFVRKNDKQHIDRRHVSRRTHTPSRRLSPPPLPSD